MSLETWKQEFYPKAAEQFNSTSDPLEVAEASLLKWTGLRQGNMDKHAVRRGTGRWIESTGIPIEAALATALWVTSSSCSLCSAFLEMGTLWARCRHCPLALRRGGSMSLVSVAPPVCYVPCDHISSKERVSPFNAWVHCHDPEPMIYWLQKTVESLKEGGKHDGNRETSSDSSGDNPPPEVQA